MPLHVLACWIQFTGGFDELATETSNHYRCSSLVDQHRIRNKWCESHQTFIESFICSSDPDRLEQRALLCGHGPGARSGRGCGTASDVGGGVQEHPGVEGHPCR